jgi:transposase
MPFDPAALPDDVDALKAIIADMARDAVAVLAPGSGRTKTGRFWVYVRDERPHRGKRPPAAVFFYSPDRKAERPLAHLKDFTGVLHADGYAGFKGLYEIGRKPGPIVEAACWAHARRKFHDVHAANGSAIARQALERIGELYAIEREIRGQPPTSGGDGARPDHCRSRKL